MVSINQLQELPLSPGCYIFKDKENNILYIGKAIQLRKRVSNYFQKKDHDLKTAALVKNIHEIDFMVTQTEIEALLLENRLIKKHFPPYNIDLKEGERYAYIKLVPGDYPYLEIARSRRDPGEYFGPFVSGSYRKYIIDVLHRQFRILLKKPSSRIKKIIDPINYSKRVWQAREILKGNTKEILKQLNKEMEKASSNRFYEYALTLRNQIEALKSLEEKQSIEQTKSVDAHAINYIVSNDKVFLLVFSVKQGILEGKEAYEFDYQEGFLDEFLVRFYDAHPIPQEIILPQLPDSAFEDYLTQKRGKKVELIVPQRGDKFDLLELVKKNIHATFFAGRSKLEALQKALNLNKIPQVMECFDISHLTGTNTVASMVNFKEGIPNKNSYRRFKIRTPTQGDDFLAMSEVIKRRYSGSLSKKMQNPDLIIIDGGLGQLHAASKILDELNIKLPIISLAKKFEEIYTQNTSNPIRLPSNNQGLHVLQAIRDEAHRFAVSYQRILRRKHLLGR